MKFLVVFPILILSVLCDSYEDEPVLPCESDKDCEDISEMATCTNHVCECPDGCSYEENAFTVTKIGEPCKVLKDCNVEDSYCLKNKCVCKKGTIESSNGKKCLKISKGIGSSCMENNQCSANVSSSVCVNHVCACAENTHLQNNICIANKSLGEFCSNSTECTAEYSECDTQCSCIKRYIRSGQKCLLQSKTILSPCVDDIQCTATLGKGSQCADGFCNCRDLYQYKPVANKCIRDMLLGEHCGANEDCHQPGPGPSRLECILGECKCKTNYEQIDYYCVASAQNLRHTHNLSLVLITFLILNSLMETVY